MPTSQTLNGKDASSRGARQWHLAFVGRVAEAWIELARAALVSRVRPHAMAPILASSQPADDPLSAIAVADTVMAAVVTAASHHVKQMACLERSLAAHRMLARRGIAAALVIGVRRSETTWEAHAWLEIGGHAIDPLADVFSRLRAAPRAAAHES